MSTCEAESIRIIVRFPADEVIVVDPSEALGIIVCGQAQAGKTTFKDLLTEGWNTYDPWGSTLPFTNSNGFRGLTREIFRHYEIGIENEVPKHTFKKLLNEFAESEGVEALLSRLYRNPLSESELRNPAVNAAVPITSEDPRFRPQVNIAGSKFLCDMLAEPETYGLAESPGLVVLDTRNVEEGKHKFDAAGVKTIGNIILTCPENVIARRKLGYDAPPEALHDEARRLRQRNRADRCRALGRMTLPKDMKRVFLADKLLTASESRMKLIEAGIIAAQDPEVAIVLRTDKLGIDDEKEVIEYVLNGMLMVAYERPRKQ
jgi:hypothetical protein